MNRTETNESVELKDKLHENVLEMNDSIAELCLDLQKSLKNASETFKCLIELLFKQGE